MKFDGNSEPRVSPLPAFNPKPSQSPVSACTANAPSVTYAITWPALTLWTCAGLALQCHERCTVLKAAVRLVGGKRTTLVCVHTHRFQRQPHTDQCYRFGLAKEHRDSCSTLYGMVYMHVASSCSPHCPSEARMHTLWLRAPPALRSNLSVTAMQCCGNNSIDKTSSAGHRHACSRERTMTVRATATAAGQRFGGHPQHAAW